MARLLMGAIVTKAVGKIGGMCFRIKNQTQILQRNPNPFKNRAINFNPAMAVIRFVFGSWKNQTTRQQSDWARIAASNPVIDRFGNAKNLSNRQFFNMSNVNAQLVGLAAVVVEDWENFVPYLTFDDIQITNLDGKIELTNYDYDTTCRMAIYARRVSNSSNNPIPSSLQLIAWIETQDYDATALYIAVENAGYHFQSLQWYSVGLRCITTSGVVSPMIQYTIQVHI
jgi:hypothetical protein